MGADVFVNEEQVEIVVATYNGEKFIREQIMTLLHQSISGEILIHDDGSSDKTLEIVNALSIQYPGRIRVLSHSVFRSPSQNFAYLLSQTKMPYVLLCDQDDIWHLDKIEKLLKHIKNLECRYGNSHPILVHSDLRVINEQGFEISRSFWKYQSLNPAWGDSFNLTLTQNVVTGCATIMNRALIDKSLPIPREAQMHDWWFALVASAFGKIEYISTPTIGYRKHSSNVIGASKFDFYTIFRRIYGMNNISDSKIEEIKERMMNVYEQARVFSERFHDTEPGELARIFSTLPSRSFISRICVISQYRFYQSGIVRNLIWILRPRESIHALRTFFVKHRWWKTK